MPQLAHYSLAQLRGCAWEVCLKHLARKLRGKAAPEPCAILAKVEEGGPLVWVTASQEDRLPAVFEYILPKAKRVVSALGKAGYSLRDAMRLVDSPGPDGESRETRCTVVLNYFS